MRKIKIKEMERMIGGSAATRMCFFAPSYAFLAEAFGGGIQKSIGRGTLSYCLEN